MNDERHEIDLCVFRHQRNGKILWLRLQKAFSQTCVQQLDLVSETVVHLCTVLEDMTAFVTS